MSKTSSIRLISVMKWLKSYNKKRGGSRVFCYISQICWVRFIPLGKSSFFRKRILEISVLGAVIFRIWEISFVFRFMRNSAESL